MAVGVAVGVGVGVAVAVGVGVAVAVGVGVAVAVGVAVGVGVGVAVAMNEKTITLRPLDDQEGRRPGDFLVERWHGEFAPGHWYRPVSLIPEGFEACDLADATKVLIGETWVEVDRTLGLNVTVIGGLLDLCRYFDGLGVLAIRPIPEPEPPREAVCWVRTLYPDSSGPMIPLTEDWQSHIGKQVRITLIEDGDGA